MRLIIARHFKTVNNADRRILGWADSPPTGSWENDLLQLDRVLAEHNLRFDAIYSSGLARASATARWFACRHGGVEVRERVELNEIDYGDLSNLSKAWVAQEYPEYKADPDFVFPNGESFRGMRKRSVECVLGLAAAHPNETLLIVAHAGVIRGLITYFLRLPFAEHLSRKISHHYLGDFTLDGRGGLRYDELAKPSGFVADGVIQLPLIVERGTAAGCPPSAGSRLAMDGPSGNAEAPRRFK